MGRTALDIFEREQQQRPIPTFSRQVDKLLGGGIWTGPGIFEVCGAPGAGKTQFCMQLCINSQIPTEFGGCGRKAVYIDTEGSFLVERLAQMAQGLCEHLHLLAAHRSSESLTAVAQRVSVQQLLEGVYVFRVFDHIELLATILSLQSFILNSTAPPPPAASEISSAVSRRQTPDIGLVVVDSVSFPYRHPFMDHGSGRGMAERAAQLLNLANALNHVALRFDVAVLVANQMTTRLLPASRRRATTDGGVYDSAGASSGGGAYVSGVARLQPALGQRLQVPTWT